MSIDKIVFVFIQPYKEAKLYGGSVSPERVSGLKRFSQCLAFSENLRNMAWPKFFPHLPVCYSQQAYGKDAVEPIL